MRKIAPNRIGSLGITISFNFSRRSSNDVIRILLGRECAKDPPQLHVPTWTLAPKRKQEAWSEIRSLEGQRANY